MNIDKLIENTIIAEFCKEKSEIDNLIIEWINLNNNAITYKKLLKLSRYGLHLYIFFNKKLMKYTSITITGSTLLHGYETFTIQLPDEVNRIDNEKLEARLYKYCLN